MVTRQPVFDQRLRPWGTTLSFFQLDGGGPLFADELTASVLLEAYMPQRSAPGHNTQVCFDTSALLDGMPRLIAPQGVQIELEEAVGDTKNLPEAVAELKRDGYGIAVSGFRNRYSCRDLARQADVLILDMDPDPQRLAKLVLEAKSVGPKVQVRNLHDWRQMLQARQTGADLFQGFFFSRMDLPPSNKAVTASQLSRLRLLECLDKPDADFKELTRLVEADAALTYRLLVFINSAGFGLGRKVESIQQALVLAGWKPLKAWLKIVLLTSMASSPRHEEYCYYAAQRADFLQRAARAAGLERNVAALSLLGLLSHLESILEMPPAQALAKVPVADAIKIALLGGESPYRAWLELVRAMERANWDLAARIGKSAGLAMSDLARCYHEAFTETDALFRNLPPASLQPEAKADN